MRKIGMIFICAFLGSGLRLGLTTLGAGSPLTTLLLINVAGCFVLPLVTSLLPWILPLAPATISGLSVGLVGSFTTFSTFTLDAWRLLQAHAYWSWSGYVGGTLLLGWLAAALSFRVVDHWLQEDRHS